VVTTALAALVAAFLLPRAVHSDPSVLSSSSDEWAEGGSEVCFACHDASAERPVLPILATQHGVKFDERTPMGSSRECQTCHGPSAAHIADPANVRPPVRFGEEFPHEGQNAACLGCHQGGAQINWSGSAHDVNHVSCGTCHTIHAKRDLVRQTDIRPNAIFKENQTRACFTCHQEQRSLAYRPFAHPVMEGKMDCTSCHNPHGSMAEHMLVQPTLNETCYRCHAEKRGPFLWEHPPAAENCANCHEPHGSNHPYLLVQRAPLLCQQCHVSAFHPSTAYPSPGPTRDIHVVAKACLNCHSEVHGSNHPSGPRFTR
jgi:DmsE family decaheme c-type cytochrome